MRTLILAAALAAAAITANVHAQDRGQFDRRYEDRREDRREWRERRWRSADIELYAMPNFRGRPLGLVSDTEFVSAHGFESDVASMVIYEGVWQICSDASYGGRCRTVNPGRYPDVRGQDARVGSLRRVS